MIEAQPELYAESRSRTAPAAPASRQAWWWCVVIGIFFAGWGLRTIDIVDTDGARHAMNGVFLHDLIASGKLAQPRAFGRAFYAHLPALSMPYHPPLFPAVEALFFSAFGVNVLAARLAIAVAVALSGVLLFRLVLATHESATSGSARHGSVLPAALSTITFLSLPYALSLSADVMLEFPALVLALLAIYCLRTVDTEFPIGRAVAYGFIAGTAVWTKQQTVFLGAVPFVYIALLGRWSLLKKAGIWVASLVFAALVAALSALAVPFHNAGINQANPPDGHVYVFEHHLKFYATHYVNAVGIPGAILLIIFLAALAGRLVHRKPTALYVAWTGSLLFVLLLIGPFAVRYLFFALPPLIALGYAGLFSFAERWPGARRWVAAAGILIMTIGCVEGFRARRVFLSGPDEAAKFVAAAKPHRIMYCGGTDGYFIFSYRAARPGLDSAIISGNKLPRTIFTPVNIEKFANRYGVEYIVVEHSPELERRNQSPWEQLLHSAPPRMIPVRDIQLASSDPRWNGFLRIYRFANPSLNPENDLPVRMNMIGGTMIFRLDQ
ncbi:MAG TPA: glycosyltransferase family 39 protein [Bryobacteraceae bacterium]|jgi:4-amino-4-deoxy-L-arabinose transferase-like glycosyltransferase|nr:glycosyltransferase family 39 protein [Bryobacteraceae bacterium]